MEQINFIPLANLMLGFLPVIILIAVMRLWGLSISNSIYANIRMLIQLLLIGYVLTFIFETDQPIIIGFCRLLYDFHVSLDCNEAFKEKGIYPFIVIFLSLALSGLAVLILISQFIVDLPRWFEPSFVVPIAGMIFANSMNTVSSLAKDFLLKRIMVRIIRNQKNSIRDSFNTSNQCFICGWAGLAARNDDRPDIIRH